MTYMNLLALNYFYDHFDAELAHNELNSKPIGTYLLRPSWSSFLSGTERYVISYKVKDPSYGFSS